MGSNYLLTLQPTFTQGLILGQLSVLVLLSLILRYLFLDASQFPTSSHRLTVEKDTLLLPQDILHEPITRGKADWSPESTEWFNVLLRHVVEVYRSKLRNDLPGLEGDEVARKTVEDYVNSVVPPGFLDQIRVHSVDLGVAAPRLSNAKIKSRPQSEVEFDLTYTDTVSISLSTSYLFNYPKSSFARLPVSLTISLSLFQSSIILVSPSPTLPAPVLTLSIAPDFTLNLITTSLMGSRAKLADVPKLHELIQHQARRVLAASGTWKVVLPGLGTVEVVQEESTKANGHL